jgi:hypothetical protein
MIDDDIFVVVQEGVRISGTRSRFLRCSLSRAHKKSD